MLSAQIDFKTSLLEGKGEKVAPQYNLSQTPDSGLTVRINGAWTYNIRTS
jgi:hypothetical protein